MGVNNAIIQGSLLAVAERDGVSLAESFLSCDAILIVDTSFSMNANDAPNGASRYQAALKELARLQTDLPGKIAVIAFSDKVEFCPGGVPPFLGAGTDMVKALEFIHVADNTGVRFILISDGEPGQPKETLNVARKFKSKIDTIFIGGERDAYGGRTFLQKLAEATGGRYYKSAQPGTMQMEVANLMLKAS